MVPRARLNRPPRQRASHAKSKGGCKTCRKRHVKCDETKPTCQNCRRYGVQCGGYSPRQFTFVNRRQASPQPALSPNSIFLEGKEVSMFQYFMERTIVWFLAPSAGLPVDEQYAEGCYNFWNPVVLQLMHHEPVMKHLVLMTSAAFGHSQGVTLGSRPELDLFFLHHYGKALRFLAEGTTDVSIVLIACCVLCINELFRHRPQLFWQHLRSGLRILENYRQKFAIDYPSEQEPWLTHCTDDPSHNRIIKVAEPILTAIHENSEMMSCDFYEVSDRGWKLRNLVASKAQSSSNIAALATE